MGSVVMTNVFSGVSGHHFVLILGLAEMTTVVVALVTAWASRQRIHERLGFLPSSLGRRWYPILALSPIWLGTLWKTALHWAGVVEGTDPALLGATAQQSELGGLALVFLVAVLPAFAEEALYRGVVLRGLVDRWPAWLAIGVTSIVFALAHGAPERAIAVLPLSIWYSVVAWRFGSTWPAVACHFGNNLAAMLLLPAVDASGAISGPLAAFVVFGGGAAFVTSLVVLLTPSHR
jgi:membrane protease YdiL (CAAX protease family)